MSTAIAAAAASVPAASALLDAVKNLFDSALVKNTKDLADARINSVTAYGKTGRISSRVYIDASVASDPVMTDILKTIQMQYCGFILTALQMNQFVSAGVTVQNLLRVVATEDYQDHKDVSSSFGVDSDRLTVDSTNVVSATNTPKPPIMPKAKTPDDFKDKKSKVGGAQGKIISLSGDESLPAGRIIEITLTNPGNPEHKITVNLLVQLAPYIVPEVLAVQFISKDVVLPFMQRLIQWKTGEISFWKDLILGSDIIKHREKLLKMDPSGTFADMMTDQQRQRGKTIVNLSHEKDSRARNIANSVLIFNQDTVTRAKADSGIDLNDFESREKYFGMTFAMIIVVVDILYNQVTFYYNGINDVGTFSFDQLKTSSKNGGSMDLISVMNALNQGKSPKF